MCDSPRIRGDGPLSSTSPSAVNQFSPYSRGWSRSSWSARIFSFILPVFAGMVRYNITYLLLKKHSPRIRGDGPRGRCRQSAAPIFSPYSRGWSQRERMITLAQTILPVFAGMVPRLRVDFDSNNNSPRIRGDGPHSAVESSIWNRFSPYSRGWSRLTPPQALCPSILPVFAGMVPRRKHVSYPAADSPRIRGDGPQDDSHIHVWKVFSPYSRGWSRKYREVRSIFAILPVFAGMVPRARLVKPGRVYSPRIRGDGPSSRSRSSAAI